MEFIVSRGPWGPHREGFVKCNLSSLQVLSGRRNFIEFQDLYLVLIQNHVCFRHQSRGVKNIGSSLKFPGGTFEKVRFHALRGALRNRQRWELLLGWMVVKVKTGATLWGYQDVYPWLILIDDDFLMMTDAARKKYVVCSFFDSERIPMKKVWGQDVGFAMRWFGFVFISNNSRRGFSMTNDESSLLKVNLPISGRNLLDFCLKLAFTLSPGRFRGQFHL